MRVIDDRPEEGDGDRAHSLGPKVVENGCHAVLVERFDDDTAVVESLDDPSSKVTWNEGIRRIHVEVEPLPLETVAEGEDVAMSFRAQQPDLRPVSLDHGVGRN